MALTYDLGDYLGKRTDGGFIVYRKSDHKIVGSGFALTKRGNVRKMKKVARRAAKTDYRP